MHTPPCLLVVDDQPMNVDILRTRLTLQGYDVLTAHDGPEALALATAHQPDLMILDVCLPTLDGLAVCRALKAESALPFMPILLLTVKTDPQTVVAGFDAGADDYLPKPVEQAALLARVKALLRIKARHDALAAEVQAQTMQAAQWAAWSRTLEHTVQAQTRELERLSRLKPCVMPLLADMVVSASQVSCLQPQSRVVTVVSCTLQGFATWGATAPPAHIRDVLHAYHTAIDTACRTGEGMIAHQMDGSIRVLFNAPLLCPDPADQAVRMALALQEQGRVLEAAWYPLPTGLTLGVGIAQGEATVGLWQGAGCWEYAVFGPVTAVATTLSQAAPAGCTLLCPAVAAAVAGQVDLRPVTSETWPGIAPGATVWQVRTRPVTSESS